MSVPGGVVVVAEETREVHGSGGWICCFRLLVPLPCVKVSSLLFPSLPFYSFPPFGFRSSPFSVYLRVVVELRAVKLLEPP